MKNTIDPFEETKKPISKSEIEFNKNLDNIIKIIMESISILFSDKELRWILLLIIGVIMGTGLIHTVIYAIDYWEFSLIGLSVLAWRIYLKIKKYFYKKK